MNKTLKFMAVDEGYRKAIRDIEEEHVLAIMSSDPLAPLIKQELIKIKQDRRLAMGTNRLYTKAAAIGLGIVSVVSLIYIIMI